MSAEPPRQPDDGSDHDIAVLISNRQHLPLDTDELTAVATRTLQGEGVARPGEVSLSFVTAAEMEELHRKYMNEPGPTDVLSFPLGEDGLLGDVVVCPEEAARANPDLSAEMRFLVAHGVLHLLGYDHEDEDERRAMWGKQERYSGFAP